MASQLLCTFAKNGHLPTLMLKGQENYLHQKTELHFKEKRVF